MVVTVVVVFVVLVSTLSEVRGPQEEKIRAKQTEAPTRIKRFRSDFREAEKEFKVIFMTHFSTADKKPLWGVYLIGGKIKLVVLLGSIGGAN